MENLLQYTIQKNYKKIHYFIKKNKLNKIEYQKVIYVLFSFYLNEFASLENPIIFTINELIKKNILTISEILHFDDILGKLRRSKFHLMYRFMALCYNSEMWEKRIHNTINLFKYSKKRIKYIFTSCDTIKDFRYVLMTNMKLITNSYGNIHFSQSTKNYECADNINNILKSLLNFYGEKILSEMGLDIINKNYFYLLTKKEKIEYYNNCIFLINQYFDNIIDKISQYTKHKEKMEMINKYCNIFTINFSK
jgi:hypothetical protein